MNYIESLQKRYSVKKFNKERKVAPEILQNILEAGRLSVSSLGLQPYKIIVAETNEMLEKLNPAFYNASQISTCSHLLAIVSKKDIEPHYVDSYMKHIAKERGITLEDLGLFRNNIDLFIKNSKGTELENWSEKQSYIMLGTLILASALENVDTCPIEGFRQDLIGEILGLDSEKEKVSVTLAIGYRSTEDIFQTMKKVRKPNEKLFKFI